MSDNLLVLQGGGPTPVLNTSLYGVLDEARLSDGIGKVLGARHGIDGLSRGDLVELTHLPRDEMERLRGTPGAALGSTRHPPTESELAKAVAVLQHHRVRYLMLIGGNGSMKGAELLSQAADRIGHPLCVIGVPKTIDNDISGTDRCPGFGSAARYVAQTVRDLSIDVQSLPQPVSIFETMGRSTGWLAGASMLPRRGPDTAPHLVYLPERAFDVTEFLADLRAVVRRLGWAVVVVAEGIVDREGSPIYQAAITSQQDAMSRGLPGGVAAYLAGVATKELGFRCRSEAPGLCGRASMLHLSQRDSADAELVGRAGVRAALDGQIASMVSLRPLGVPGPQYELVPLKSLAGRDRIVPKSWIGPPREAVNAEFLAYAAPLVGCLLEYAVPLGSPIPTFCRSEI